VISPTSLADPADALSKRCRIPRYYSTRSRAS
jgi:hypothetical protein